MEKDFVLYSDFGAVGDGVNNDFEAIRAAHEYANAKGLSVKGEPNKKYYIGRTFGQSITVKTDTDWCGAEFVIDDTSFEVDTPDREIDVFKIKHDSEPVEYSYLGEGEVCECIRKINSDGGLVGDNKKKIFLGLGHEALVYIFNENKKNFIRFGNNQDAGSAQCEIVLIDKDGNVSGNTPVYFDYTEITKVRVISSDEKAISVGNGTFTTIANQAPREYTYYMRGIMVNRSNATLYGIDFRIVGEGDSGAPYEGSIAIGECHNVTVRDSVVTAHKAYKLITNDKNTMGTYGLVARHANLVTYKNVTMHNFFAEGTDTPSVYAGCWGVMGSSYCKNITYDGCKLTRFDAHCGTYNATIRNSDVGTLTLIGNGTFRIENSKIFSHTSTHAIMLRRDYGSTWDGEFVIDGVTVIPSKEFSGEEFAMICGGFTNWNFGYPCYMPKTVFVNDFKVDSPTVKRINLATGAITAQGVSSETFKDEKNNNPYTVTEKVVVKGNSEGYKYTLPSASDFKNVEIEML